MPAERTQELTSGSKKRKAPPSNVSKVDTNPNKRSKTDRRLQQRDVRTLAAQTSSKALKNGELDVDKFVKAREFEIRALEEGISRSRKALSLRAFQQVPKELRRRTASHNVKRVPKRLQLRARREMIEDNTPTVTARRRKLSGHQRLRLDTAKKLRVLGAKRKSAKGKSMDEAVKVMPLDSQQKALADGSDRSIISTRAPKIKGAQLAEKPLPKAKFRKRQFEKSWLPTHVFHAKRAHMTPPKQPLWGFALPLTPTVKSYRPTHRAANERGAIVWDTSYMSTIGLEGQQRSLEGILNGLGFDPQSTEEMTWSLGITKWRRGLRAKESFVFERELPNRPIAPVTVLWATPNTSLKPGNLAPDHERRKIFLRVHPSAFPRLWEEVIRLAKTVRPQARVEDLRYEIGSIEVSGPSATEALVSALQPHVPAAPQEISNPTSVEETWKSLAGVSNLRSLPADALLGFNIQDPRLHFPPQTIKIQTTDNQRMDHIELLAAWPVDDTQAAQQIFERSSRISASSALPSQKSINRRKARAGPGQYPSASPKDPKIPLLLYSVTRSAYSHDKWVLLIPWKCLQPVWYGIMYHPLTTGGQPRLGGVQEQRQLAFESGVPWFPADFPGTEAGWKWEQEECKKREEIWQRLPKSKRINWDNVDLGHGKKGEIGVGWACDWHALCRVHERPDVGETSDDAHMPADPKSEQGATNTSPVAPVGAINFSHISSKQSRQILLPHGSENLAGDLTHCLAHVRIDLLGRGVPHACARIYRLPRSGALRRSWLNLRDSKQCKKRQRNAERQITQVAKDAPPHVMQQRLAQSLLDPPRVGDSRYPLCPGEEDLIGFVTTGNFNLGEGRATGVGCVILERVMEEVRKDGGKGRLCVVRNAGSGIGRLAKWSIV